MSAGNFYYKNRCIVVTDEDLEYDNFPPLTNEYLNNSLRAYPSRVVDHDMYLRYFEIVLTAGYYEGACLDFQEKDGNYIINDISCYIDTKKDLIDELCDVSGLSKYRIKKLLPPLNGMNFEEYKETACDIIDEYLMNIESEKINNYLDKIKESYNFEEYATLARFSNCETIYKKIS